MGDQASPTSSRLDSHAPSSDQGQSEADEIIAGAHTVLNALQTEPGAVWSNAEVNVRTFLSYHPLRFLEAIGRPCSGECGKRMNDIAGPLDNCNGDSTSCVGRRSQTRRT